jgi:RNA polymerase sigma factor (sigma-70 family)
MFEELVRLHQAELTRFAVRQLGEHANQAEDVVQEALLNAHRAIRAGTWPEHPRAWLFTIVHNAAINAARGTRLTDEIEERRYGTPDQTVAEAAEQNEWIDWLMGAVGQLPARQRDALVGHAFEGRSHREIAARLATTVPAVKSLIGRARHALSADSSFPAAGLGTPFLAGARVFRALLTGGPLAGKAGGTKGLAGVLAQAALAATVTTGVLMAVHSGSAGTGLAATGPPRSPNTGEHRTHEPSPRSGRNPARERNVHREGRRVVSECMHAGVVGRHYSEAALQFAAQHLTTDALEYTDCERQLDFAALQAAAKRPLHPARSHQRHQHGPRPARAIEGRQAAGEPPAGVQAPSRRCRKWGKARRRHQADGTALTGTAVGAAGRVL